MVYLKSLNKRKRDIDVAYSSLPDSSCNRFSAGFKIKMILDRLLWVDYLFQGFKMSSHVKKGAVHAYIKYKELVACMW